jgi:hypothetical protein
MARTRIVAPTSTNEVHTEDMPLAQPGDIKLPDLEAAFVPDRESVSLIEKPGTKADDEAYFNELKFNEDVLTIILEPGTEDNSPLYQDTYCNGVCELVPVGREYKIKRKFLESLVRAQPVTVRTEVERRGDQDPLNHIRRTARAKFPLSILHDPAGGRGHEWLRRIRAQG